MALVRLSGESLALPTAEAAARLLFLARRLNTTGLDLPIPYEYFVAAASASTSPFARSSAFIAG